LTVTGAARIAKQNLSRAVLGGALDRARLAAGFLAGGRVFCSRRLISPVEAAVAAGAVLASRLAALRDELTVMVRPLRLNGTSDRLSLVLRFDNGACVGDKGTHSTQTESSYFDPQETLALAPPRSMFAGATSGKASRAWHLLLLSMAHC